jgi:hypothetical protein
VREDGRRLLDARHAHVSADGRRARRRPACAVIVGSTSPSRSQILHGMGPARIKCGSPSSPAIPAAP